MVIKTGRRISSLELENESSDNDLAVSSDLSIANSRSLLGPQYVFPVDYSFAHNSIPSHLQLGIGTNSQRSHG